VHRSSLLGLGLWALGLWGGPLWGTPLGLPVSFHHIHVNALRPDSLLSYYEKLFDRSTTKVTAIGSARGIEASGVFLLVAAVREEPPEQGAAGWHFGWGTVSLSEAYDQHRMQEIDLTLPMASFAKDLHLHLESEDPLRTASWYRDRMEARISTDARNADVRPANTYLRRPAAIVELSGVAFAIYQTNGSLESSRGHRIDHIAFKADLRAARAGGFKVIESSGRLGSFETMTIE